MLEAKQFAERLPGRVNRVLDALAGNELRLKVDVIDEGAVIDGLQKVANRIALGLVLAALIVGAAMMMQVPTTFRLFGYPGLAMILFILAAGGGAMLAVQIVVQIDRERRRADVRRCSSHVPRPHRVRPRTSAANDGSIPRRSNSAVTKLDRVFADSAPRPAGRESSCSLACSG